VASDVWEARGLIAALGAGVPVFAGKSYFGNLGAGGATTELAASLIGLPRGLVPATLNYEEPDPDCPLEVIRGSARELQKPYFLKVSFTEMGQCAAVVCKKWE
jgi:3-oxoacyl-[acyl-carrier-protein] synthase II